MSRIILMIVVIFVGSVCGFGQSATSQSNNFTEVLNIVNKPRPIYTDKARKKNVEGWVRLQVTFLANGQIGEVVYLTESSKKKKLTKYGLTARAIEAAKEIKFVPAKNEKGNPIDVTKTVEYNFTIYDKIPST